MKKDFNGILLFLFIFCVEMFPNGTNILKLIKLIFVVMVAVYILFIKKFSTDNVYSRWLFGISLLSVLSYSWAASTAYALSGIQTVLLNSLCCFCVFQLIIYNINWKIYIVNAVAFGAIARFIYVFFQNGFSVFRGLRNIGIVTGYNAVGMISGLGVAFCIVGKMLELNKKHKWNILLTINIVICVFSMSRKAMIYLIVPLVILYIFSGNNILKKLRNVIIVLLSLIVGYYIVTKIPFLYNFIGKGLESILQFMDNAAGDESAAGRMTRIQWGLTWFRKCPIYGYGIMNFNYLFSSVEKSTAMIVADNNYIEMLVNFGIIGVTVYYFIFVRSIIFGIVSRFFMQKERIISMGILLAIIIGDFGSSSYIYLHSQLFLLIAILLLYDNNKRNHIKHFKFG